jgi:hypothetical protein
MVITGYQGRHKVLCLQLHDCVIRVARLMYSLNGPTQDLLCGT